MLRRRGHLRGAATVLGASVTAASVLAVATDDSASARAKANAHRSVPAAQARHRGRGHTYVRDTFRRPTSTGWGRANRGGNWVLAKGQLTNFSVANGQGLVAVHAAYFTTGEQILVLPHAQPLNYGGSFVVSFGENINTYNPQHGGVVAYLVARYQNTSATGYYRMGLVWEASTRHLWLRTQDPAGRGNPNNFTSEKDTQIDPTRDYPRPPYAYNVKVQITGTRPTNFGSKVWKVGTPEPAGWMLTGADSNNYGPQGTGPIGFRVSNDLYTGTNNFINYTAHVSIASILAGPPTG